MFAKLLKIAMVRKGITQAALAEALEISRQNLNNKLRRDNFTESEMDTLCASIGAQLKIEIVPLEETSC